MPSSVALPAPVRERAAAARSRLRSLVDRGRRFLFGHDVFISYARADAIEYAQGLADQLTRHRVDTYVDELGSPPGPTMPPLLLLRLRLSNMLVLLASPAAAKSRAVAEEVETYVRHGSRLFVVDVEGALDGEEWYRGRIKGGPSRRITRAELAGGVPSERVVEQILKNVDFARREDRLRRTMRRIGAGIAALLVVGGAGALFLQRTVASLEKKSAAISMAHRARAQMVEGTSDDAVRSLLISVESLRLVWTVDGAGTWVAAMSALAPRLGQVPAHAGEVRAVAASPDGRRLASAGDDGLVRFWNVAERRNSVDLASDGKPIAVHTPVTALAWSRDGRTLAAAYGQRLDIWAVDGPRIHPRRSLELADEARSLAFGPAGLLAVAESDRVRLVDTDRSGSEFLPKTGQRHAATVAFSPDGRWLAVGGSRLHIWNVQSRTLAAAGQVGEFGGPSASGRYQLAFDPGGGAVIANGVRLLLRDSAGTVRLVRDAQRDLSGGPGPALVASSDGRRLLMGAYQGAAIHGLGERYRIHLPVRIDRTRGAAAAFHPRDHWVAVGANDGMLTIWPGTPHSGTHVLPIPGAVRSIAFSPAGPWLALSGRDGVVHVLRAGTWATELRVPLNAVPRFSRDGRWLLAVSDSVVFPFATESWRAGCPLPHPNFVADAWTSPDGRYLATRSAPGQRAPDGMLMMVGPMRVTTWELATGEPRGWRTESPGESMLALGAPLGDHPPQPQASDPAELAWRARSWLGEPDAARGEWLVNAEQSTVALSEAATGREVVHIEPGQGRLVHAEVSHDGTWLATLGEHGTVRLVRLGGVTEMIAEACRRVPRNLTRQEWSRVFPGRPYRHTCPALGEPSEPIPVQAEG